VPFEGRLQFAGVDMATIEQYRADARDGARRRLEDFATRTGLAQGSWETCVVEAEAPRAIVEQAQGQHCDLIVLGKHGSSATQDLLLGSVTRQVLAEGTTDVLVSTQRAE
jgi:nucleotide-binding universal stress UspA family protein